MKNGKRILSVCIKRMIDDSPDTSWLGEYSNRAETEYSIDRKHSLECQSVNPHNPEGTDWLDRVENKLNAWRYDADDTGNVEEFELMEQCLLAIEIAREELAECDCNECGDMGRGQYRYFNGVVENYLDKSDPENDADIRKYVRQDYERMESLNAGHWCFIGIRAETEIRIPYMTEGKGGRTYFKTETISSPGLFGVESDSDKAYFADIEKEELSSLREELRSLGFSSRAISTAFKNVERKED